jgi:hypothetical protein
MYRALEDQLRRAGGGQGFQELRRLAAEFIQQHPDDFVPFLMDEEFETDDLEDELLKYCAKVGGGVGWWWGGAGGGAGVAGWDGGCTGAAGAAGAGVAAGAYGALLLPRSSMHAGVASWCMRGWRGA